MGVSRETSPLGAFALAVGGLLCFAGVASAQQFSDVSLNHSNYPGLSEQCYEALNTTVQSCPGFLAIHSVDLPRLESPMLDILCTSDCSSSLASVRGIIVAGCAADTDVIEIGRIAYPATFMVDRMIHAYDVSCATDRASGMYCDEIYLDNLANGTTADGCSDCALRVGSILLNSPFEYDESFASDFASRTSSCGATVYDFTPPVAYALSTKPYATPTEALTCSSPYVVQEGDSCNSIARAKGASTHSIIRAGRAGPGCIWLFPGKSLCLPEPCTLYQVKADERCNDILAAVHAGASGLRHHHATTASDSQHRPVSVQKDQSQQVDVPSFTNTVNTCDYASATYGVILEDFLAWNPSLEVLEVCQLQPGYRYCVDHVNATDEQPWTGGYVEKGRQLGDTDLSSFRGGCPEIPLEPEPGTIDTCSCFTILVGWDAGYHGCEEVVYKKNFTIEDLLSWNSWIGSSEADCDAGLYAGMAESDERALCTNGVGGTRRKSPGPTSAAQATTRTQTTTATTAGADPTSPVPPTSYGFTLDNLYAWNSALNGDCSGLWPDYAYCVEGPTSSGLAPPSAPTRPGTVETCKEWHMVVSSEGCWDIQQLYGIADYATLLDWNPSLGSDCEGLCPDYAVCVGI